MQERGRTASLIRVFCSSASLLKSSRAGMVYCIAREVDAIVEVGASQLAREAQGRRGVDREVQSIVCRGSGKMKLAVWATDCDAMRCG